MGRIPARILSILAEFLDSGRNQWRSGKSCHGFQIQANDNPEMALMEACGCITAEMAQSWFRHAIFGMSDCNWG
jgi:hypothetical protein